MVLKYTVKEFVIKSNFVKFGRRKIMKILHTLHLYIIIYNYI